jgi:hypothetical protein
MAVYCINNNRKRESGESAAKYNINIIGEAIENNGISAKNGVAAIWKSNGIGVSSKAGIEEEAGEMA